MEQEVLKCEVFVNEVLREDLKIALAEREKLCSHISEHLELKNIIEKIQNEDFSKTKLKTKVDLGSNFYVQATVPCTRHIFVQVGLGFFVQFTLDEAIDFINMKEKNLREKVDEIMVKIAHINASIKVVLDNLRELQQIDPNTEEKPRRELW